MGGKLAVVVRHSNAKFSSFKAHTKLLSETLNDPKIFDESWLRQIVASKIKIESQECSDEDHANYGSNKALRAPYMYGILVIDYVTRKIMTYNHHSAILTGSTAKLNRQYSDAVTSDFILQLNAFSDGKVIEKGRIDLRTNRIMERDEVYFLETALRTKAFILSKGNHIQADSLEEAVGRIYGLHLTGKTPAEQASLIDQAIESKPRSSRAFAQDYYDIEYVFPEFDVKHAYSMDELRGILNYMNDQNYQLSNSEKDTWENFIEEESKKEDE